MNKKTALLLCSTAALLTFNATGQAAPAEPSPTTVPPAQSYADLLAPIPNAVEMLQADNLARVNQPRARVQLAQYHHHHHHYHHHHHHGFFPGAIIGGIIGGALAPPPPPRYYYEHCYWTRGRPYWNGYRWVHPRVRVCD
jgi:hypothetical protein